MGAPWSRAIHSTTLQIHVISLQISLKHLRTSQKINNLSYNYPSIKIFNYVIIAKFFVLQGICRSSALCSCKSLENDRTKTPLTLVSPAVFSNFGSSPSLTPDDDVFQHLALTYSTNHAKMSRGVACKSSQKGFNGVRPSFPSSRPALYR